MVHHVPAAGRLHLYTVMQSSFTPACILFDFYVLIYSIIAYLAYIYAGLGLFLYVYAIIYGFYTVLCGKIEHLVSVRGLCKRLHKQHYDK